MTCIKCGRPLTDPESIARQIGPTCRAHRDKGVQLDLFEDPPKDRAQHLRRSLRMVAGKDAQDRVVLGPVAHPITLPNGWTVIERVPWWRLVLRWLHVIK